MKLLSWPIVAMRFALGCALVVLGSSVGCSNDAAYSMRDSIAFSQLNRRPLNLPVLSDGERCPISHGSQATVPHVGYIFCAGCFWYGKGPVFMALAWSDQSTDEARFAFDKVPYEQHAYRAKTPWVSKPEYAGPILIRGRLLTGNDKLRFTSGGGGNKPIDALELQAPAPGRDDASRWSFWPTSMFVPRAGCYGIQIDTPDSTDVIIFEATGGR
jgi:hypothetical protein